MALSAEDKKNVTDLWHCITPNAECYGAEALYRMFITKPQTTIYFPKFDIQRSSPDLKRHGKKVMNALTEAVNHLENIPAAFEKLSDLHAYNLRVDPCNFNYLAVCILVVCAVHHPDKFSVSVHRSMDKFLAQINCVLTSKYR